MKKPLLVALGIAGIAGLMAWSANSSEAASYSVKVLSVKDIGKFQNTPFGKTNIKANVLLLSDRPFYLPKLTISLLTSQGAIGSSTWANVQSSITPIDGKAMSHVEIDDAMWVSDASAKLLQIQGIVEIVVEGEDRSGNRVIFRKKL